MYQRVIFFLQFASIMIVTFPLRFLPLRVVRALGYFCGHALFYLFPKFRKRTLSNLALATDLHLTQKEIIKTAKESFVNLCITILEYPKLKSTFFFRKMVVCENPEVAKSFTDEGQGVIFFCAHQANWEVLFMDGNLRMPGVAIGKPIKNPFLYRWVVSVRERFGGKIIPPKRATWEGMRALKQGKFLGIVGDQGMPSSDFESSFLGRRAYTSTIPALLAYKSKSPLLTALIKRTKTGYSIKYTQPLIPDTSKPLEEEVSRLMNGVLDETQKSIIERPGEWLWQHNRWKQETPHTVFYKYRHESLLVVANKKTPLDVLTVFREIYPRSFLTYIVPKDMSPLIDHIADEVITFTHAPPFVADFRFKLVFDFTDSKIYDKYKSLSAFDVLHKKDITDTHVEPKHVIEKLCRGGVLPYAGI